MNNKLYTRFTLLMVVLVGFIISTSSGIFLYKLEESSIINEFQQDVDKRATILHREVIVNFEALRSLAILFSGGNVPEWKLFSKEAKKILDRHHDIQALEWIPRVNHSDRSIYENRELEGRPKFTIVERESQGHMVIASERPEYFPVYYIEPLIGNEAAYGFDLASNKSRLEALELSRDTALPTASATITLVQERESQKGFLAFIPIYLSDKPSTVETRRTEIIGFILGVFRIGDIFESSALGHKKLNINMKLIEETQPTKVSILHVDYQAGVEVFSDITYKTSLPVTWGRNWSLIGTPTSEYFSTRRNVLPIAVFVSFLIFTIYIAVYINVVTKRAAEAQKLVSEKSLALDKANKNLKRLSRSDGLTGIANRGYMDEFLEREWANAIRSKSSISLILIDIDYFKLYNDNFGHPKGDDCLKRVAKTLDTLVNRPNDLVARYGGEEFALILPSTTNANNMAENCRCAVEKLRIPHEFSKNSDVVTISVGFCMSKPKKGSHPRRLIEATDIALYKAKEAGRNKVVVGTY